MNEKILSIEEQLKQQDIEWLKPYHYIELNDGINTLKVHKFSRWCIDNFTKDWFVHSKKYDKICQIGFKNLTDLKLFKLMWILKWSNE